MAKSTISRFIGLSYISQLHHADKHLGVADRLAAFFIAD